MWIILFLVAHAHLTRPVTLHRPNAGPNAKHGKHIEWNEMEQPSWLRRLQVNHNQNFKDEKYSMLCTSQNHRFELTGASCFRSVEISDEDNFTYIDTDVDDDDTTRY